MTFHNILKPDEFFYSRSFVGFCLDIEKITFKVHSFPPPPPRSEYRLSAYLRRISHGYQNAEP